MVKLGRDFIQWYLASLCPHSVDRIILHEERVGGNLRRFMMCMRCMWTKDIPDYLIEAYEKYCATRVEIDEEF